MATKTNDDIHVVALVKGAERYIFTYYEHDRAAVLRTLGKFASNPDLSFSWMDAATLSQKVRETHCDDPPARCRSMDAPAPRRCTEVERTPPAGFYWNWRESFRLAAAMAVGCVVARWVIRIWGV